MWRCLQCRESVEDEIDVCWNCGASIDGTPDPDFERDPDAPREADVEADASLDASVPAVPGSLSDESQPVSEASGMTRHEIASLICKSLALLLLGFTAFYATAGLGLVLFGAFYSLFSDFFDWHELVLYLILAIPLSITALVGWFYWKWSDAIAKRMVSADPRPVTVERVSVADLMMVGFSIAGLFVLIDALRGVAQLLYLLSYNAITDFWASDVTWSVFIHLGLGLWLILGSRGIVNAVLWLRSRPVPSDD